MDRLPGLTTDDMSDAQRRVHDDIVAGPRGSVRGPFPWLLRSAGLADKVQNLGAHIRYESKLPANLRELAILTTSRFWRAQYEWYAHAPLAEQAGVSRDVIAAIQENRRPDFGDAAEATVYDFCTAMLGNHAVDNASYAAALEALGDEQLVDLVGLMGHYSLLAMLMATFDIPVPGGEMPLK